MTAQGKRETRYLIAQAMGVPVMSEVADKRLTEIAREASGEIASGALTRSRQS